MKKTTFTTKNTKTPKGRRMQLPWFLDGELMDGRLRGLTPTLPSPLEGEAKIGPRRRCAPSPLMGEGWDGGEARDSCR